MTARDCWLEWHDGRGLRRRSLAHPARIGRDRSADIILTGNLVSRQHAIARATVGPDGGLAVHIDATPGRNGIIVDGRRERQVLLRPGAEFTIGQVPFRVVVGPPARTTIPPAGIAVLVGGGALGLFVVLLVAILLVAGRDSRDGAASPVLAEAPIAAAAGGEVSVPGGATVRFAPGALDRDTTVRVTAAESLPAQLPGTVALAGEIVDISIGEARVQGSAEIALPAWNSFARGYTYDEHAAQWVELGGRYDAASGMVHFETRHFSVFAALAPGQVEMRFPFDRSAGVKYSGGPHQYGSKVYCPSQLNIASGLDFSGTRQDNKAFEVLAVAPSTYLGHREVQHKDGREVKGAGNWVLTELANGLQVEYWHLGSFSPELEALNEGDRIPAGFPIGVAGASGDQTDEKGNPVIHLHLELRRGATTAGGENSGTPQSWHGRTMNGWTFWAHRDTATSGPAYQGSATQGATKEVEFEIRGRCNYKKTVTARVGKDDAITGETDATSTIFAGNGTGLTSENARQTAGVVRKEGAPPANPPPANDLRPGGVWLKKPPSTVADPRFSVEVEARPAPGRTIDYVNVTLTHPGASGWRVVCELRPDARGKLPACEIDLERLGVPVGEFRVSFDVYDTAGDYRLAPNGVVTALRLPPNVPSVDFSFTATRLDADRTEFTIGVHEWRFCYELSPDGVPFEVRVLRSVDGGPSERYRTFYDDGGGSDCVAFVAEAPQGRWKVRVEAYVLGRRVGDVALAELTMVQPPARVDPPSYAFTGHLVGGAPLTVNIGDDWSLCYRLTPENVPFTVEVHRQVNGGAWERYEAFDDDGVGGGGCVGYSAEAPAGSWNIRLDALVGGRKVGEAFLGVVRVTQPPPRGDECTRPPSPPSNPRLIAGTRQLVWDIADPGGPGCVLSFEVNAFSGANLWRGSVQLFNVPSVACGASYFIGARNQNFDFRVYTLWSPPC